MFSEQQYVGLKANPTSSNCEINMEALEDERKPRMEGFVAQERRSEDLAWPGVGQRPNGASPVLGVEGEGGLT